MIKPETLTAMVKKINKINLEIYPENMVIEPDVNGFVIIKNFPTYSEGCKKVSLLISFDDLISLEKIVKVANSYAQE